MAILSNINGKFAVESSGAIQLSGSAGTSGYVLKSNGTGNAASWVDPTTIIGGPYLPLSGGTLTGATATASNIAFTVGGNLTVNGSSFLEATDIVGGSAYPLQVTSTQRYMVQVRNLNNTVSSNYGWWWFMDTNFNMGFHADGASDRLTLTRDGDLSVGGFITTPAQERISVGTWDNSAFTGGNAQGFSVQGVTPGLFILETDQTNKKSYLAMSGGGMYLGGSINFLGIDTDGARAVTIDDSQRVGIGDTSPAKPLVVYSAAPPGGVTIKAQSGNASNWIQNVSTGSSWQMGSTSDGWQLYNDNTSAYRVTVQNSGNVGIGATSFASDHKLQIHNASGTYARFALTNSATGTGSADGLRFQMENLNSIIKNTENGYLTFGTNGRETDLRIDSAGDVLMGNTVVNPASGFASQRGFGYDNSTGNVQIAATSGNALTVGRNESSDGAIMTLRKESNVKHSFGSTTSYLLGNVGIGTTSPGYKLHVSGTGGTRMSITNTDTNWAALQIQAKDNQADYIFFKDDTEERARIIAFDSSDLVFSNTDSATERMRITSAGNIGIGTTSPSAKLEVVGSNGTNVFRGNFGGSADIFMGFDNANPYLLLQDNSNVTTHLFQSNVDNYIVGSDLGIGTTTPTHAITIEGNSRGIDLRGGNNRIYFTGYRALEGATNGSILQVGEGYTSTKIDSTYCGVNVSPSGFAALEIQNSFSTSYSLYADYTDTNGSYGVMKVILTGASTSPSYVDWWYGATQTGAVVTTGSSTQYLTSSDYRLKENIVPMSNAIDRVKQLKPSRFNFIGHENTVDGLIAHEVAEVVPEAVNGKKDGLRDDGTPKYQGIDEGKLVPLLIGAIQELEARVKELENK